MSTTIESLELEIKQNSQSAVSGIDALTQSLTKLRNATKGGLGLTSVANQLNAISTATKNIGATDINNMSGLSKAIRTLSGVKISSALGSNITSLSTAINSINASGLNNLSELVNKVQPLSGVNISGTIGKSISSISTAIGNINVNGINNLSGLITVVKSLSGVKVSSTIGNNINLISNSIKNINRGGISNLSGLTTALGSLSHIKISNNMGKNLTSLFDTINTFDGAAFTKKIEEMTKVLEPLATQMEKIASGFSALSKGAKKVALSVNNMSQNNDKGALSFLNLGSKILAAYMSIKKVYSVLKMFIDKSSDYLEDVNLFTVAMGKYAGEASEYAKQMSEIMGIDTGEWMRNQGLFQTLVTGFGVGGESAAKMSKNLTQLAYDLSSFYNIDVETAMQKLKSGMAGELEPLRAIGYDLSQAKLEATALELGIDKTVSSMTQAEKSMLRYYAILSQVTVTQGDMARTLDQPANQMRILKAQLEMLSREIGNVFMPLLQEVLPYLIAITKVLREIVSAIATLVGYEPPDMSNTGVEELASGTEATEESLESATEQAKKLKSYMLGFDELNVINPNDESSNASTGVFDIDLPDYSDIFSQNISTEKLDAIVEKVKEWLGVTEKIDSWSDLFETKLGRVLTSVGLVGGALLLWKLSDTFLKSLDTLSVVLGATILVDSFLVTLQEGLTWQSAIEGAIGGALVGAGIGFKLGGVKGGIGGVLIGIGVSLVINSITSMIKEGLTFENVTTMIVGLLTTVGGILTVVKLFNKTHPTGNVDLDKAGKTIGEVSTGTSNLTSKLKGLVTNLALGIVIIAEVAVATMLIAGAIWVLGKELEQVGKAWEPVIENGETVAIGMGIGTALLVGIGVATALLGKLGKTTIVDIALGTLILAEMGVATILFTAEIIVIGKLLEEVGKAWKPVLENGETIATGIGLGTALLVGIGIVAAALGVATVATAGLLPLAIGLGTLMLVELGLSFIAFTDNIVLVAKQLKDELHPALDGISEILPGLTTDMGTFTTFMGNFAGEIVKYSINSAVAGIASTISNVIAFFDGDPVKQMSTEVNSQKRQFDTLVKELEDAIPKIKDAVKLQKEYNDAMSEFAKTQTSGFFSGVGGFFEGISEGIGSLFSSRSIDATANVSVIPTYATGGFPESGQAFIARENGIPEMVGTIGRRTAVANNDQIVESISVGVADANSEQNLLLREQNSLLRALLEKDNGVYLDGRSLSESVDKHKREQGRVIMGGAL